MATLFNRTSPLTLLSTQLVFLRDSINFLREILGIAKSDIQKQTKIVQSVVENCLKAMQEQKLVKEVKPKVNIRVSHLPYYLFIIYFIFILDN